MAVEDGDAWDLIDRVNASWDSPAEGAVAVELWRTSDGAQPYAYALVPLVGDWRALLNDPSLFASWQAVLERNGIFFDVFRISEFSCGEWEQKALWSRERGVLWAE